MNTLCLPFYKDFEDCELDGDDVDARYLIDSDFSDGTLTLTFSEGGVLDWIGFGEPYIIRWGTPESNPGTTLTDPVFTDVVIPSYYTSADAITAALASASCKTDYVDFIGTYSPLPLYESGDEKHNLYLGAANTLYYPTTPSFHVNAFRGYFQLKNGLTVGEPSSPNAVRAFNLNFADGSEEAQGIRDNKREPITNNHWYTIDGVRLDGKPTKKGLYIHGGRKVVVK